MLISNKV